MSFILSIQDQLGKIELSIYVLWLPMGFLGTGLYLNGTFFSDSSIWIIQEDVDGFLCSLAMLFISLIVIFLSFESKNARVIRLEKENKLRVGAKALDDYIKKVKIKAFKRRNYQSGHNQPTAKQKEAAWLNSQKVCVYCKQSFSSLPIGEISFWWQLYPNLELIMACDSCAKREELYSKEIESEKRSRRITKEVQDRVWNRDGGKCVNCGSSEDLEFDHIVPHSKGGSNTYRNIQLLCESCNRSKSNKIG